MKCEHKGCGEEATAEAILGPFGRMGEGHPAIRDVCMCPAHLAAWLREKADEVEGVKERGAGNVPR
jgi:hypothetical protein